VPGSSTFYTNIVGSFQLAFLVLAMQLDRMAFAARSFLRLSHDRVVNFTVRCATCGDATVLGFAFWTDNC
jgi:hypothetical protein